MGLEIKPTQQLLKERGCVIGGFVQKYIDSESVRLMEKYTPFQSGTLRDSAFTATQFGSGEINQTTPYARRQYYDDRLRHRGITTHHWFEAMKTNGGKARILNGAARLAGAKGVQA